MPVSQRMLADILSGIAQAVADEDRAILSQINEIIKGKIGSKPVDRQKTRSKPPPTRQTSLLADNHLFEEKEIVRVFNSFPDRERLEDYISKRGLKKVDLIYIAKLLKVAVYKTDDAEAIIGKIIDATLGYKLRSQTIRGKES